jgi:pyrimidine operon attenuation protein/uracil phosphoribosyltransferase
MGDAQGTFRKLRLMDAPGMDRVLARMSREIIESLHGTEGFALVGIRTRGVPLARRLAEDILASEKVRVPVGLLDITLYRDDLTTISSSPVLKRTEINFPVEGKTIVLCDDVLFTGRTVRAAIDAILDFGRPDRILLAILVDRGRRELPIEAQFVGKKISTSSTEIVSVTFHETDGEDDVWLLDREEPGPKKLGPKKPAARKKASPKTKAKTEKARKAGERGQKGSRAR